MKLLFDQNISFRIVSKLKDTFSEAQQVRELGFENSTDRESGSTKNVMSNTKRQKPMSKIFFLFLGLIVFGCSNRQGEKAEKAELGTIDSVKIKESILVDKSKKGLMNDWVITDNFYSDTIVLNLLDSASKSAHDIVTFNQNGTIDYWKYNPIPRCGNGIYYLDSTSNWTKNVKNGNLILVLNGGVSMYGTFKKKIEYNFDTSQLGQMSLTKSKVHYDIQKDLFGK